MQNTKSRSPARATMMKKEKIQKVKRVKSRVQHEAWQAGKEWRGGGVVRGGCFLADQTIFLMLGLLKLPALRCFWT